MIPPAGCPDPFENPQVVGLVDAARSGSRDAMGRLIELLRPWIDSEVRREWSRPRGEYARSDVAATIMLQLCGKIGQFRGDSEAQLLAFVRQLIKNKILDLHRRSSAARRNDARERRLASEDGAHAADEASPVTRADRGDRSSFLRAAFAGLAERDRWFLAQHEVDGRPLPDLARERGISTEAAKKCIQRARERLRQRMLNAGGGLPPSH